MRQKTTIRRQELYEQVWQMPTMELAARYGVSDVGLAKLCKRHNIPRPGRGYWAKVHSGRNPRKKRLPDPEDNTTIQIQGETRIVSAHGDEGPLNELQQAILFERDPSNKITARERLSGLHPLVKQSKEFFTKLDNAERWQQVTLLPHLDVVYHTSQGRRRGLLLMDALIRALEARGFSVIVVPSNYSSYYTYAIIWNVAVGFEISEQTGTKAKNQKPPWMTLTLGYAYSGGQANWNDTRNQHVAELLNSFVEAMLKEAWTRKNEIEKEAIADQEAEVERQRRAKFVEEHAEEARRVESLVRDATNWEKAEKLRAYICACQATGKRNDDWLKWASEQADRFDPLVKSPSSVLDAGAPPASWRNADRGVYTSMSMTERYQHEKRT